MGLFMKNRPSTKPFRSAKDEVKNLVREDESPQVASPSYRLAFTDTQFLLRQELRPVRLQLELLKPELMQQDEQINSTVVIFGSARISEAGHAKEKHALAEAALAKNPHDKSLQSRVKVTKNLLDKCKYYDYARDLSRLISSRCQHVGQREFVVVTGGGPGIMEAANRGAFDVDAKSIGLNIVLPAEQGPNPYISPELCFQFHYFAVRKMHFLIRARALIAFPGGYGTLDELFEALTLLQTRKITRLPVLLFGREFWSKIVNFEAMMDEGTIDQEDLELFQFVETPEEAWQAIVDFYQLNVDDSN